jgi:hypothetical protein
LAKSRRNVVLVGLRLVVGFLLVTKRVRELVPQAIAIALLVNPRNRPGLQRVAYLSSKN